MKTLVTGGAGFLGSHLCERLLARGDFVICVDDFSTGVRENIAYLMQETNFELMHHDVVHALDVQVTRIFNLASPASPVQYQLNPVKTVQTNVLGCINLLDLAKRCNARILQASTSEIYGDPEVHPQTESYWGHVNPIGVRSCYDEGKRCAETLFFDYHRQYGVDIRVARIFNTYGPKMLPADGRVISTFICQALSGMDITIHGDGSQTRSFCYVDDLVSGLILMMDYTCEQTGPINLGNPEEFSMLQLADTIIRMTNSTSRIVFRTLPADDPRQRRPDISRAMAALSWKPDVNLETGLANTIRYFRELNNA